MEELQMKKALWGPTFITQVWIQGHQGQQCHSSTDKSKEEKQPAMEVFPGGTYQLNSPV